MPRDVPTIAAPPLAPFHAAAAAGERDEAATKKEAAGGRTGRREGVDATEGDAGGVPDVPRAPPRAATSGTPRASCGRAVVARVARAPRPPPPATFVASVSDALARVATGVDLASLTRLNLHASGIAKISGLDRAAPTWCSLGLSFNAVTKVEGLDPLARLERLDLGFNALKRIEGLAGLGRLEGAGDERQRAVPPRGPQRPETVRPGPRRHR